MGKKDITEIIIQAAPHLPQAIDLLGNLISWIGILAFVESDQHGRKAVKPQFADGQSYTELDNLCKSRLTEHFQERFSYAYNGDFSMPRHRTPGDQRLITNEDFFNAQSNNLGAIGNAIGNAVQGTVPTWAAPTVINDLTSLVTTFASGPATNKFEHKAFTLSIPNAGDTGDAWQMDIAWVYCTTAAPDATDHSKAVNTLFLYSITVGYHAQSLALRSLSPGTIPVVRIAFAYTTMVVGTAIAAFIYSAKDKPASILVTVNTGFASGTIAVATKGTPKFNRMSGQPAIQYGWVLDALEKAGVSGGNVSFGSATAQEAQEIALLMQWESS